MTLAFVMNPPEANPAGRPRATSKRGLAWRELVRKHGVLKAAEKWRARVRKPSYAAVKGKVVVGGPGTRRKEMAANPKGAPKSARGRAWRSLVKKYGVLEAASRWKAIPERAKPRYAANVWFGDPAGHRKAALKGWRNRKGTAKNAPARRKYRQNEWKGDTSGHRIAALAGHARRAGVPVPAYLHRRGVTESQVLRHARKHGPIMAKRRYSTKSDPATAWRKVYAQNPDGIGGTAVEVIKAPFSMEGLTNVLYMSAGAFGAVLGGAVAGSLIKKGEAETVEKFAERKVLPGYIGKAGGSLAVGVLIGVATKNTGKGILAASSGLAYTAFHFIYNKALAGKKIPLLPKGTTFPTLGEFSLSDFVSFPRGMSDYVALPEGTSQFTPAEELSQFTPASELGGEEEIEYEL